MAFSLTKLPEELISAVAWHVTSRGDLFNLALASRQMHRIATPHLYGDIALLLGYEYRNYERLFSLVIGLLKRPDLAALVQHLKIRGQWTTTWEVRKERAMDELHPVLKAGIEALTPDRKNKRAWASNIVGWAREEALVAILLHHVPNLRTLDTNMPEQPGMHWRWLMRQLSFEPTRLLSNLQELALVHPPSDSEIGAPLLALPRLKSILFYDLTLKANMSFNEEPEMDNEEYMTYASTLISAPGSRSARSTGWAIENFEVIYSYQDLGSILPWIDSCKALRTFALDIRKNWVQEHSYFYNAVIYVLSSLHAETLTALYIGDDYDMVREPADPLSFHELVNLNHLRIPVSGFLGFDHASESQSLSDDRMRARFPPSLQELVLLCYKHVETRILPTLQHYLGTEPAILPNLKNLDIHCHAPEAAYAWLCQPARRYDLKLRVFRKLRTKGGNRFITPFVESIGKTRQDISEVQVEMFLDMEDVMAVEEFKPDEEVLQLTFEIENV